MCQSHRRKLARINELESERARTNTKSVRTLEVRVSTSRGMIQLCMNFQRPGTDLVIFLDGHFDSLWRGHPERRTKP
jgi:hypothetical protein